MESGASEQEFGDVSGREDSRQKLLVKRTAYRRFSRWMDQQLAELVRRWSHLSTPISRRIGRVPKRKNEAL